jgi:hypothetical protein
VHLAGVCEETTNIPNAQNGKLKNKHFASAFFPGTGVMGHRYIRADKRFACQRGLLNKQVSAVTPCRLVGGCRRFEGSYCLYIQGQTVQDDRLVNSLRNFVGTAMLRLICATKIEKVGNYSSIDTM